MSKKKKEKAVLLKGHDQLVTAVCFDPSDGNLLASASADSTIKLWDLDKCLVFATLECEKRVASITYSHDGCYLVSGDWSYLTKLWDVTKKKVLANLQGHSGKVTCTHFRQDGSMFLTGSEDKTARAWDPRRARATEFAAPDEVLDCKFSPDGGRVLAACKNGDLLMWDVRQHSTTLLDLKGHADWVTSCDYSPDGKAILSGSTDRCVKLWDAEKGTVTRTFEGHLEAVNGCRFCGQWIISCAGNRFWGSKDNRALMFDADTGKLKREFSAHSDALMGLDSHRPTARFATASMDKTIRVWDAIVPSKEKEKEDGGGGGRKIECPLGCGKSMVRSLMDEHRANECPNRLRECVYCKESMPAKDVRAHESGCNMRTYSCECGAEVVVKDQAAHEEKECGNRKVQCSLGCGMEVKFSALAMHEESLCQERVVTCKQGCGMKVVAKEILEHVQHECRMREVACAACGIRFMAKDEKAHKRKLCGMRTLPCPLGCGAAVMAKDMAAHEQACGWRVVACALCGAKLRAAEQPEHDAAACPALAPCPHGCGLRLPKPALPAHAAACPRRPRTAQRRQPEEVAEAGAGSGGSSPRPRSSGGFLPEIDARDAKARRSSPLAASSPDPLLRGPACSTCGAAERTCSNAACGQSFCPRCLQRLGLPKATPPLCAPCTRGAAGRYRDNSRSHAPSPFRFR